MTARNGPTARVPISIKGKGTPKVQKPGRPARTITVARIPLSDDKPVLAPRANRASPLQISRIKRAAMRVQEQPDVEQALVPYGRPEPILGAHSGYFPMFFDPKPVLNELRANFVGVRLADRYEITKLGDTLRIRHKSPISVPGLPSAEVARRALLRRLDLVYGIGPARYAALREVGYSSILDLCEHPGFGRDAVSAYQDWEPFRPTRLCDRLTFRLRGVGHLLSTLLSGLVELEEIVFLDTETLGLDGQAIFLCGLGRFVDGRFVVDQFFAPNVGVEKAMLEQTLAGLAGVKLLVTFNGRSADITWLKGRFFYHRMGSFPEFAHVDLLYGTRRQFIRDRPVLSDGRLPTVQSELLKMARPEHDVPSWAIPNVYDAYTKSRGAEEGLLVPIIDHNRSDIEALVILLEILAGAALERCQ